MKGLIKKDLLMVKNYCKSYIIFLLVFLIFPLFSKDSSFISAYLFLLPSMAVITIITYDERNNWETYFRQLPIKAEESVLVKYIIGTLFAITILFVYSICMSIRYGISFIDTFMTMSIVSCVSFTITMPFYFRFGSHVGRIAYYVSLGIVVFIATQAQFNISPTANIIVPNISKVIPLIGLLLFVGSYFLSTFLYKIRLEKLR